MFLLKIITVFILIYFLYKIVMWFKSEKSSEISSDWFWDHFDDNGDSGDSGDFGGGGDSGGGD